MVFSNKTAVNPAAADVWKDLCANICNLQWASKCEFQSVTPVFRGFALNGCFSNLKNNFFQSGAVRNGCRKIGNKRVKNNSEFFSARKKIMNTHANA